MYAYACACVRACVFSTITTCIVVVVEDQNLGRLPLKQCNDACRIHKATINEVHLCFLLCASSANGGRACH